MILVRRIVGDSMLPGLRPGRVVVGVRSWCPYRDGDIIVLFHDGREKIKRISRVEDGQVYVLGDNPDCSTDSRHFGWLSASVIKAKVVWPRFSSRLTRH